MQAMYVTLPEKTFIICRMVGVFEVHGDILAKYKALGGTTGMLAFPLLTRRKLQMVSGDSTTFREGRFIGLRIPVL